VRPWQAALAALALHACGPSEAEEFVYHEDFETTCDADGNPSPDGGPCGWIQTGGPDGSANYLETLPGDHGIQLTGDMVSVRGPAGRRFEQPAGFGGIFVSARVIARCDRGSSLQLRATVELAAGGTTTIDADVQPDETWMGLLPEAPFSGPGVSPGAGFFVRQVLGVSILKLGEGSCEVDRLAIHLFTPSR
jgi:hypothetical protein